MPLTNKELEELEKKYFLEIKGILEKSLEKLVDRFNSRLAIIRDTAGLSYKLNEVDAGAERVLLAIICREKPDWEVNSSPISSDALFETEDVLINIDAKTYRDRQREEDKVNIRRNQTNYGDNIHFISRSGVRFTWKPSLKTTYNHDTYGEIPCLTYIVKFIYNDDDQSLVESQLISIPNGRLVDVYGKNIFRRGKGSLSPGKPVPDIRFKISLFESPRLTTGWERKEVIYKKTTTQQLPDIFS